MRMSITPSRSCRVKKLIVAFIFCLYGMLGAAELTPGRGVFLQDEGTLQGRALRINCVGSGVACALSGGTGTLTISGTGGAPGSDTQVIFNDGGAYGADAGLTYVKATDTLVAGQVGIGTTGPGAKLDVRNNDQSSQVWVRNGTGAGMTLNGDYPGFGLNAYYDNVDWRAFNTQYTGAFQLDPTNGNWLFYTGNNPGAGNVPTLTQKIVLTNAGDVRGYASFTDASNNEGWALSAAVGSVTLAAYTNGTGSDNISLNLTPAGTGGVIAGTKLTTPLYSTSTNCADAAGDAACAAAAAGAFVIDATDTNTVVSTTAVTANSRIFIQEDSSLGTELSVTCNTAIVRTYAVTARTAPTSFTVTASAAPITNPACLSYMIVN